VNAILNAIAALFGRRQRTLPCTGYGAKKCPNCGWCTCPEYDGVDYPTEPCPLHGPDSKHDTP
jgi:hypothetical protein